MAALTAQHRLATYGTLAPGRSNHHELADLKGDWSQGFVRGHLIASGWGAAEGFPGIQLDPQGPRVEVNVLEAPDLPNHWRRLDVFEGVEYQRVVTLVQSPQGAYEACIYVLRPEPDL
ncbi:MAG: gamma-glutamylcyclotransferase [Pseudomonadota bacterium]